MGLAFPIILRDTVLVYQFLLRIICPHHKSNWGAEHRELTDSALQHKEPTIKPRAKLMEHGIQTAAAAQRLAPGIRPGAGVVAELAMLASRMGALVQDPAVLLSFQLLLT